MDRKWDGNKIMENYRKKIGDRNRKAYLHIWEKPYGWVALRVTSHDNEMGSQVVWFGLLVNCAQIHTHEHICIYVYTYACMHEFRLGFYYAYQINNGIVVVEKKKLNQMWKIFHHDRFLVIYMP